ncbi:hypothetical protein K438DRAFT_1989593 [Mycena galopus ATCC 62051]|nr:hypothetical protein K438DRAFT_1989593 [Mycena galopus ATCC 62051]
MSYFSPTHVRRTHTRRASTLDRCPLALRTHPCPLPMRTPRARTPITDAHPHPSPTHGSRAHAHARQCPAHASRRRTLTAFTHSRQSRAGSPSPVVHALTSLTPRTRTPVTYVRSSRMRGSRPHLAAPRCRHAHPPATLRYLDISSCTSFDLPSPTNLPLSPLCVVFMQCSTFASILVALTLTLAERLVHGVLQWVEPTSSRGGLLSRFVGVSTRLLRA